MTIEHRPSGTRPYIGSVPALSISVLHLRGWRHTEHYGPASRTGGLSFSCGGVLIGKVDYKASIGPEAGTLTLKCSFNREDRATEEHVEIVSVPNTWGGRHWFFACPLTGARARKLHRWPGLGFSHRLASPIPPIYACQRDSGIARTARSMHEIRKQLGGIPGKVEKPLGMPLRTFYRLCSRYIALHERFWRSDLSRLAR